MMKSVWIESNIVGFCSEIIDLSIAHSLSNVKNAYDELYKLGPEENKAKKKLNKKLENAMKKGIRALRVMDFTDS